MISKLLLIGYAIGYTVGSSTEEGDFEEEVLL